jgi:hypothetical protein
LHLQSGLDARSQVEACESLVDAPEVVAVDATAAITGTRLFAASIVARTTASRRVGLR